MSYNIAQLMATYPAAAFDGTEGFEIIQDGKSRGATIIQLLNYLGGFQSQVANFNLSGITVIPPPALILYDGQLFNVAIIPNGNSYSWNSLYVFSVTWPEQPMATNSGFMHVYTFTYIKAKNKLICTGQSLFVPFP